MAARNKDNAGVQEDGGRIYRIDRNLAETYDNFIDLARDRGMIEDGVKTVLCFSPTIFDEQPPPAPPAGLGIDGPRGGRGVSSLLFVNFVSSVILAFE